MLLNVRNESSRSVRNYKNYLECDIRIVRYRRASVQTERLQSLISLKKSWKNETALVWIQHEIRIEKLDLNSIVYKKSFDGSIRYHIRFLSWMNHEGVLNLNGVTYGPNFSIGMQNSQCLHFYNINSIGYRLSSQL